MTKFYALILCFLTSYSCFSQTVALDPSGAGGFEIGTTFATNGWTVVNAAANQWAVGSSVIGFGTRSAYIGNSSAFFGVNTFAISHFYRDIAIPATATNVMLKFKYFQPVTDDGFDSFYVSVANISTTPFANIPAGTGFTKKFSNTGTIYSPFTSIPAIDLSSLAGTTVRLVFTYRNDGATPIGVPAIDSIALTYCDLPAITGVASVCVGGFTTFSHTTSGGTWSSSNASIASIGLSTGDIAAISAGTATITYTTGNCTTTRVVTVNSSPAAENVTGGGGICATGGSGAHIGLDGSETGVDYTLLNGSSVITTISGTGTSIDFGSFMATGTYTVTASNVTTTCSADMTGSAVISIATPVTPSVTIAPDVTDVCSGSTVTFTATPVNGGSAPSYQWKVDGSPVGLDMDTYSYAPVSGEVVSVTLTPSGICTDPLTASNTFTVSIAPSLTPAVTINVTPGNPSCLGKPVTFSVTSVGAGAGPLYVWTRNSINVATGPSFTCTPANGDVFFCTLTSNYNCRTADNATSNTIAMTVQAGQVAPTVNIVASPGTTIATGQSVSFTAVATGGTSLVSYLWYVNGAPIAGATSATYETNALNNGDIVTCRATNTDVCANSTLKSVTVSVAGLGVDNINTEQGVSIFPNPNKGSFFVKGTLSNASDKEVSMTVINTLGEVVYSMLMPVSNGSIDQQLTLDGLTPGIYTMNIHSGTENKTAHFVVVR